MIFLVAFVAMLGSAFVLAGVVANVLADQGRLVWFTIPVAVLGSLLVCYLTVLAISALGLASSDPFEPAFGSWVVTSWTGVPGMPLVILMAIGMIRGRREEDP